MPQKDFCNTICQKQPSAPRRYLLDSSGASYQIPAKGLYALLYRAAVDSFAGLVPSRHSDR
jgi:hypothetical protein